VLGLWTPWFHSKALVAGWIAGIAASCAMAYAAGFNSNYTLHLFGQALTGFIALYALALNLLVSIVVTLALRLVGMKSGIDRTTTGDYA
jgi:solute:Na+ symporter, SSS family